jgi:hypothetical protein
VSRFLAQGGCALVVEDEAALAGGARYSVRERIRQRRMLVLGPPS